MTWKRDDICRFGAGVGFGKGGPGRKTVRMKRLSGKDLQDVNDGDDGNDDVNRVRYGPTWAYRD